jgi:hypothetical protein
MVAQAADPINRYSRDARHQASNGGHYTKRRKLYAKPPSPPGSIILELLKVLCRHPVSDRPDTLRR